MSSYEDSDAKSLIKRFGKNVAPRLYSRCRLFYYRRLTHYGRLTERVGRSCAFRVSSGPFEGLRYFSSGRIPLVDLHPTPKLLGSFEQELHPWLEQLVQEDFPLVINIGSAEGYYAVGLALRIPTTYVIAFDPLPEASEACARLSRLNGVSGRVTVEGECRQSVLRSIDLRGALIICDCEGCEVRLLNLQKIPALATCTLIVELHDALLPGSKESLLARFRDSHTVLFAQSTHRDPAEYTQLRNLTPDEATIALDEDRVLNGEHVSQEWVLMTPRIVD